MPKVPYLFEHLTYEEINDAAARGVVCVLPIATIEDHGPHLPVDTDVAIVTEVCARGVSRCPQEAVLLPTVKVGYSPHHIDFPGTLTIRWTTFVEYCLDITRSLVHHGFTKMLIVNGHGSNRPLGEMAARLTIVEHPHTHCAFTSWWDMQDVRETFRRVRESEITSHACELETSVYLAIDESRVYMDRAERGMSYQMSPHFWGDLLGQKPDPSFKNPLWMTEFWSIDTEHGIKGDATKATKEKGRLVLEAAAGELVEIVRELRARPVRSRVAHQRAARTGSGVGSA